MRHTPMFLDSKTMSFTGGTPTSTKFGGTVGVGAPKAPGISNPFPEFAGMNNLATGNIMSLLGGMPSAAPTQRANAYFGVSSGMPGSDFVRNRGFDLYGEEAEGYKQRGFDNFLNLLGGYSGTVMPTAGQQMQNQQFYQDMATRNQQANAQMALEREAQELNELKAGKGVPWNSTATGNMYDRFGSRLNYDPNFDRTKALGALR